MIKRLKTLFGTVTQDHFPVEPTPQRTRPLIEAEERLRRSSLAELLSEAVNHGVASAEAAYLTPEELDRLWQRLDPSPVSDAEFNHFAHLFGFALGEYLVQRTGLQWCVLADQYGSDYAVRHHVASVTAFPVSSVGKRLERHESGFFQPLAASIVHEISAVLEGRRAT